MSEANRPCTVADVYADDDTAFAAPASTNSPIFLFRIVADGEPDVLARVAGIFNIANVAPQRAILLRDSQDQVTISIQIELSTATTADMICRKLEQLTCTLSVECNHVDSAA